MNGRPVMVLICGCSGVGKSTLAEKLADRFDYRHIDVDKFYEIPGETGRKDKFEAWISMFRQLNALGKLGRDCIVDTAGLTSSSRDEFLNWFPEFEHHMVYVEADDRLRQKNNESRERRVPAEIMMRQYINAERPVWRTMDKGWVSYTRVVNSNNNKYDIVQKEGNTFYESVQEIFG